MLHKALISLVSLFFPALLAAQSTTSVITSQYLDSLRLLRENIDTQISVLEQPGSSITLPPSFTEDTFTPFYSLSSDSTSAYNNAVMHFLLNHPELIVQQTDTQVMPQVQEKTTEPAVATIIQQIEEAVPEVPTIAIQHPNFWNYNGDFFLQFLQNYISENWYKGGESNYSMVSAITLNGNYNNKQKVKWDNTLELKLGFQTSRTDSLHKYKTSEDLIRFTSKLGLQASKRWYYTVQLIAYTQFTRGYKNNDPFTYSDIMSPFNLNLSFGMDYNVEWLNKKLTGNIHLAPVAFNYRYVGRRELATRYGLNEGKRTLLDKGSQFTVDLVWKPADNIQWKTRLYGYTTYKRAELEWENTITFKFNRFISTNIFIYPRFDDSATRIEHHSYWQLKEYASVGFAYSF